MRADGLTQEMAGGRARHKQTNQAPRSGATANTDTKPKQTHTQHDQAEATLRTATHTQQDGPTA